MARFPYTNLHDMNLNWIVNRVKEAFSPANPPPYPVRSVNGQTGDVVLDTSGDVDSVNGKTGAVTLYGSDIEMSSGDSTKVDSAINAKYTKPAGGIPASDIAPGVIPPDLTNDVNKLKSVTDYFTNFPSYVKGSKNADGTFVPTGPNCISGLEKNDNNPVINSLSGANFALFFYADDKSYIGKVAANGTINKTAGDWKTFPPGSYAVNDYAPVNGKYFSVSVIPTDGTTITNDTTATTFANAHCYISRKINDVVKSFDGSIETLDDLLIADSYEHENLTWTLANGYWANNKTFATYSGIYTSIIDVSYGEKYLLSASSYYGMCIGVYYSGDTVTSNSIVDIIHLSNDSARHINYETFVPYGATHLLLQQYYSQRLTAYLYKIIDDSKAKNPLSGKLIAYNGDSICESRYTGNSANGGAYAQLIADAVGCLFENRAISGGILASTVPAGVTPPDRFVVSDVSNMIADADLVCFEGGLNDFYLNVPLGTFDADDYTGAVDTTTVCGALESIFRQAVQRWVGKPICFIIIHRCWSTKLPNTAGYTFAQMREKMIGICEKYAIPYYDAYTKSGLNAYNPGQTDAFLNAGSTGEPDGMHPNENAYKAFYVPQLIEMFNSIINRNN